VEGSKYQWVMPYRAASGRYGSIIAGRLEERASTTRVQIDDADLSYVVTGDVEHGRVRRIEYQAREGAWVTHRVVRSPNLVTFLERWAALANESLSAIEFGDDGSMRAYPVPPTWNLDREQMLEALEQDIAARRAERRPARRRGADAERLLLQVARRYDDLVGQDDPEPRKTIGAEMGYSASHIGRLLVTARRPDPKTGRPALLGRANPGKAGQAAAIDQHAIQRWARSIGADERDPS